ncbi:MAG: triose-phosphate isomerase [Candidatus Shapirobacteria bacterium]|jgi:triosephosphate isomerase
MIIINFKLYSETFGENALKLAKIIKKVSDDTKHRLIIAASSLDAFRIKEKTGAEVWLQNIDDHFEGRGTGWISFKQAQALGLNGSLLNHSEHRIPRGKILKILKNKPDNFEIALCVASLGQISQWAAKSKADFLMYEPPSLIASPDKSVATNQADSIKNALLASPKIPLIVGAGIKNKEDTKICSKLGINNIALSSAFVLNPDPESFLRQLISGFNDII